MRGADAVLDRLAVAPAGGRTFANTVAPLEAVAQLLGEASGRYGFLSQVSPHEETRGVAFEYEQKLATFATGIGFREDVYEALKSFAEGERGRSLDGPEARLLEYSLRDFRRNGMELSPERRQRVREQRIDDRRRFRRLKARVPAALHLKSKQHGQDDAGDVVRFERRID